ncbi:MAG TPA: formyltransferase family protein, partial [Thermoanaerobaculia bacterium]|nr:formyltransferase family protein [Thermoanaerobaculia bacterium]
MKILLLTSANNSLCQATHVALSAAGHEVAIELFLEEDSARAAIALFEPDLILCPMLKKRIPADIWQRHVCIILHPGIRGDRGASSLDWAILEAEQEWGLTALQAAEEMDAGDIWAWETFPTRAATKSSLYRNEVVEAGVRAALKSVERFESGSFRPTPLNYSDSEIRGRLRPTMGQDSRRIDWSTDSTAVILRKVRSADGAPGVLDQVMGGPFFVYGAWEEGRLGEILG